MSAAAAHAEPETVSLAVRVRQEVWESLVSMLRVYANAASLSRGEFAVTSGAGAAWVRHKGETLALCFNPADGLASSKMTGAGGRERESSFQILPSGALIFEGEEKELDQAALDWMEELAHAGAAS